MKATKRFQLHILLFAILLMWMAVPAAAETEEPLELTVEADPECLLSAAGEMTYFRFTLKNTSDAEYVFNDLTLRGDLLDEPKLIGESLSLAANDVMEFTLESVHIDEDEFDRDLAFQLTWHTTAYAEEDSEHLDPITLNHSILSTVRVERFVEPVMTVSLETDVLLAREGDMVTVTYTLFNDTKFDMTNITLQDPAMPQGTVPLEKNTLLAGERMQVVATAIMGTGNLEFMPSARYTVRGIESAAFASGAITVEYVDVELKMEVEKYPATAEGTLFRIKLINAGSHPMTDIRIVDEIGTLIADGIALEAGNERTISCTVPSAVSASSVRYISFEATGRDGLGGVCTVKSPSAYEVLPYVDSDQVRLNLSVSLTSSAQNDDGSNRLKLLFEIRNDSRVPISNAVITEADYFKSVVNEYGSLSTGTTTFEKEFTVPAGTRSLTFVMSAMDPAQTQYATVPMTLDLSPLTAPKPTSLPQIQPGKTVDTTGTIYDTERYARILRMSALIVLALTLMFLLLSVIFRVAELNIRRFLPKEAVRRPFGPRKTPTGPIPSRSDTDTVRAQFGYMQPAKLRYMDRTDRIPLVEGGEEGVIPPEAVEIRSNTMTQAAPPPQPERQSRTRGDITAVSIRKQRQRPAMMSSDHTMPFPAVHEDMDATEAEKAPAAQEKPKPKAKPIREKKAEPLPVREEEAQPTLILRREPVFAPVPEADPAPAPVPEEQPADPVPADRPASEAVPEAMPDPVSEAQPAAEPVSQMTPEAESPAEEEAPFVQPRVVETKPAPRVIPKVKQEVVFVSRL